MAEKRMISKVISISKKFNIRVDDHFSRLLYVLLIPHADDFGRLTGDPFKIKALILPMMEDVSWGDVEMALTKLHNAELVIWYENSGEKYIQILNFDEHQTGLHKRTRSKFPDPPNNSGKFREIPLEQNRTEEKGTEQNGTENGVSVPTFDGNHKDTINGWLKQYNVQCKGFAQLDDISAYYGVVDIEVIEKAIKESENKNVPYAISIIERYKREGKTTKESIQKSVPPSNREAETQQRLAEERKKTAEVIQLYEPDDMYVKEAAAGYEHPTRPTGTTV